MATLYKYSSFSIHSLETIRSEKVWFSDRSQLNDPFDCDPEFVWDATAVQIETLGRFFAIDSSLSDSERRRIIEKNYLEYLQKSCYYCVSEDPVHELMWAHYGANHTGLILGWEQPTDLESLSLSLTDRRALPKSVDYAGRGRVKATDVYRVVCEANQADADWFAVNKRIDEAAYFSKTHIWRYEAEKRYVAIAEKGLRSIDAKLVSITLGLRFPTELIDLIRAVKNVDVRLFQIRILNDRLYQDTI